MKEILSMSVEERILLIEKIWDSISDNNIEQELNKRLARHAKGETTFVRWEDIKAEIANR